MPTDEQLQTLSSYRYAAYRYAEGWAWLWGLATFIVPTIPWLFDPLPQGIMNLWCAIRWPELLPERALAMIALFVLGPVAISELEKEWARRYLTNWWDDGDGEGGPPEDWGQVFSLASLDSAKDPLVKADKPQHRKNMTKKGRVFWLLPATVGILFGAATHIIVFPGAHIILNGTPLPSENIAIFVGFLTAAVTVLAAFKQLMAKVRADSRQSWINEVRKLMSLIVTDIANKFGNIYVDKSQLNQNRIQLELMLNPSEKDHRLLTLLIRACVIPGTVIEGDGHITDEVNAFFQDKPRPSGTDVLWEIVRFHKLSENPSEEEKNKVISHIVKLSHIVLKREWERVKRTR